MVFTQDGSVLKQRHEAYLTNGLASIVGAELWLSKHHLLFSEEDCGLPQMAVPVFQCFSRRLSCLPICPCWVCFSATDWSLSPHDCCWQHQTRLCISSYATFSVWREESMESHDLPVAPSQDATVFA